MRITQPLRETWLAFYHQRHPEPRKHLFPHISQWRLFAFMTHLPRRREADQRKAHFLASGGSNRPKVGRTMHCVRCPSLTEPFAQRSRDLLTTDQTKVQSPGASRGDNLHAIHVSIRRIPTMQAGELGLGCSDAGN